MIKIINSPKTKGKDILINKNGDFISGEYDVIFLDSTAPYLYIIQNEGYYNILSINENRDKIRGIMYSSNYFKT